MTARSSVATVKLSRYQCIKCVLSQSQLQAVIQQLVNCYSPLTGRCSSTESTLFEQGSYNQTICVNINNYISAVSTPQQERCHVQLYNCEKQTISLNTLTTDMFWLACVHLSTCVCVPCMLIEPCSNVWHRLSTF